MESSTRNGNWDWHKILQRVDRFFFNIGFQGFEIVTKKLFCGTQSNIICKNDLNVLG